MPAQLPRLPKISVIQSFKVAAELGSLAKAAAQLALTPAAVSQQIRQLEEQLGSALFLRTQSGVMLTETGKEYLRYVTEAFDILHLGQQNIPPFGQRAKTHGLHIAGAGVQMAVAPAGELARPLPEYRSLVTRYAFSGRFHRDARRFCDLLW